MFLAPRTFFSKFFLYVLHSCHFCLSLNAPFSETPSLTTWSRLPFSTTYSVLFSWQHLPSSNRFDYLFVYVFISSCPTPLWSLFCLVSDCVLGVWHSLGMKWTCFDGWISGWSPNSSPLDFQITETCTFLYSCHVEINGVGIWFI